MVAFVTTMAAGWSRDHHSCKARPWVSARSSTSCAVGREFWVKRASIAVKRKTCRNCHYLTKSYVQPRMGPGDLQVRRFSWSDDDRAAGDVGGQYGAECKKGIWDKGAAPALELDFVLAVNRRSCPHHVGYQQGMLYEGADSLLEDRKHRRRSVREWITVGLAAVGWLTAGVLGYMQLKDGEPNAAPIRVSFDKATPQPSDGPPPQQLR